MRGQIFHGALVASSSGAAGLPITYGAYGSASAKPVISGFREVTSWTNLGSNIWESAAAISTLSALKLVVINNVNTPMGRYPNADASYPFLPNYLTFQSHSGSGLGPASITSDALDGVTNWVGADLVVRVNHWTLDKETITGQSGKTLSYTSQAEYGLEDGWGFWIQNDPRTLDVQNEWYYNPVTKKIRIYSVSAPTNVKVADVDDLFSSYIKNYITIDGLSFAGANNTAIVCSASNHTTVINTDVSFTGDTALQCQNTSNNLYVENSSFSDFGGAGIWNTDNGKNWIIKNNTFARCDLVSVIKPNDYTNGAIEIFSDNALVQYNTIDSSAYEGIHFRGNNVQVRNNFVSNVTMIRDDGGGIYTGFTGETGKVIDGNVVLNSIGNGRGVPGGEAAGNGIYLDGLTDTATVTNNTVAHTASAGIFLNNGRYNEVHGNTVYDAGGSYWTKGALMVQTYDTSPYVGYQRGNNVTNNIFFQPKASQYNVFYFEANQSNNSIADFGVIDSNYYAKGGNTTVASFHPSGGDYQNLDFPSWRASSGKEANGSYYNKKAISESNVVFVYNPTKATSTFPLGGNYADVKGATYNGSITLSPFSSAVLIYSSPTP